MVPVSTLIGVKYIRVNTLVLHFTSFSKKPVSVKRGIPGDFPDWARDGFASREIPREIGGILSQTRFTDVHVYSSLICTERLTSGTLSSSLSIFLPFCLINSLSLPLLFVPFFSVLSPLSLCQHLCSILSLSIFLSLSFRPFSVSFRYLFLFSLCLSLLLTDAFFFLFLSHSHFLSHTFLKNLIFVAYLSSQTTKISPFLNKCRSTITKEVSPVGASSKGKRKLSLFVFNKIIA